MVWTANRNVRTEISSVRTARQNLRSFRIGFQTRKQLPIQTPKAAVRTYMPETPILTRIKACKAYK
jgi:hypothetical protein